MAEKRYYIVEYIDDRNPDDIVAIHTDVYRFDAEARASYLSKVHGVVYVVATNEDGLRVGQRVYAGGILDNEEGDYRAKG